MAIDGDIKFSSFPGSCQVERSKDLTLVNAINYQVEREININPRVRNAGKRTHQPFSVTCGIDKAAPEVWKHLCSGQKIDEVVVRLWHNDVEGVQVNYMTFTLEGVIVTSCEFTQLHNLINNAVNMSSESMVEYQFSFDKITVTYNDGSGAVEASDKLTVPALPRVRRVRR